MTRARLICLALWGFAAFGCDACHEAAPPAPTASATPPAPRRVREPTAAGRFYPATEQEVSAQVQALFAGVTPPSPALPARVRMVLLPHAGWEYSGAIGAAALSTLDSRVERVVIVAANHNGRARFAGVSVDRATHYRVPGFDVAVDPRAAALLQRPGFVDVPQAHTMHMIESELPLLAHVLGRDYSIIPLIVGDIDRDGIRDLAQQLAQLIADDTAVVISVDLSHYYPYDRAQALDRACLAAIESMDAAAVADCDTDGTQVLLAMTQLAAIRRWTPHLLAYRNSGDVTHDHSGVVGYGAIAFTDDLDLTPVEEQALLELARASVNRRVLDNGVLTPPAGLTERLPRLAAPGMSFVTLRQHGELRGCIGSLLAVRGLAADVAENAAHAAADDPRFSRVSPEELPLLELSISVLSPPKPLDTRHVSPDALAQRFGRERPGVVLEYRRRRSTFLPSVWEELPDPIDFLTHLCRKQSSPEDCWRQPQARYETYAAEHFGQMRAR